MSVQVVRYSYRLRPSKSARRALEVEWDRVRWVWNRCVERSLAAHMAGETCGPAKLDKELTSWRAEHDWLALGASVPQQQVIRDFGAARAKALKDIVESVPPKQRRDMPRFKCKGKAQPSLNYTKRGFSFSDDSRLRLAAFPRRGGLKIARAVCCVCHVERRVGDPPIRRDRLH